MQQNSGQFLTLGLPTTAGKGVEGNGDLLLYCFPDKMMKPSELETFFSVGFDLMSLLAREDVQRECVAKEIRDLLFESRQS